MIICCQSDWIKTEKNDFSPFCIEQAYLKRQTIQLCDMIAHKKKQAANGMREKFQVDCADHAPRGIHALFIFPFIGALREEEITLSLISVLL